VVCRIKKLLAVVIILLFIGLSVIPSTANPLPEVDVELRGRIGVIITIKNIGNETVNFMNWSIFVKGGHFKLIDKSIKGNVTLFEPSDEIVKRILVFGFGFIDIGGVIIIPISPNLFYEIYIMVTMFAFGPYVYQRPSILLNI